MDLGGVLKFLGHLNDFIKEGLDLWGVAIVVGQGIFFGRRWLRSRMAASVVEAPPASAVSRVIPTVPPMNVPAMPPSAPQWAPAPQPAPVPLAPATVQQLPASIPLVVPKPAALPRSGREIGRPELAALAGLGSTLFIAGFIIIVSTSSESLSALERDPIYGLGLALVLAGLAYAVGAVVWAVISALMQRRWGWAIGVLLGSLASSLILMPGLVAFIYALRVPVAVRIPLRRTRLGLVATAGTICTLVGLVVGFIGSTNDINSPLYAIAVAGFLLLLVGVIVGYVAATWGVVSALRKRSWGWAIGIVLGSIATTFIGMPALVALIYALEGLVSARTPQLVPVMAGG